VSIGILKYSTESSSNDIRLPIDHIERKPNNSQSRNERNDIAWMKEGLGRRTRKGSCSSCLGNEVAKHVMLRGPETKKVENS
jgi:hypothetical protein